MSVKDLLAKITTGADMEEVQEMFDAIMAEKAMEKIDELRLATAQSMFNEDKSEYEKGKDKFEADKEMEKAEDDEDAADKENDDSEDDDEDKGDDDSEDDDEDKKDKFGK